MWLIANYWVVGLFSLKHALSTSSGGKSLLVPTPFALKMALLDAAFRLWGVSKAEDIWSALRDMSIALCPPDEIVVTNLFTKILKPRRSAASPGSPDAGPLGKSIGFREYVWSKGSWEIALRLDEQAREVNLTALLLQINYLGKRGGFIQLSSPPERVKELPSRFVMLNPASPPQTFDSRGLLQMLDDCSPKMTFEHADIYSGKGIKLGKERVLKHVVLPYRLVRSSKSYTFYQRIEAL
jgi:hypothetical protein